MRVRYISLLSAFRVKTIALTLLSTVTLTLTHNPNQQRDGHWHKSERRPRARHGAPKTRGGAKPSERRERGARVVQRAGERRVASGGT